MIILHIVSVSENSCNGVCFVVPQYVLVRQTNEIVGFLNLNNCKFYGGDNNAS